MADVRSTQQTQSDQAAQPADNTRNTQNTQVSAQQKQTQRQDTSLDEDQDLGPSADNWNAPKNR